MSCRSRQQGLSKGQSSSRTKKSKSTGSGSARQSTISSYFTTTQQVRREEKKPDVLIQGHTSSEGLKSESGKRKLALSVRKRKSAEAGLNEKEKVEKEDNMNLANKQLRVDDIEDDLHHTTSTITKSSLAMKSEMGTPGGQDKGADNKTEVEIVDVQKSSDGAMEMEGTLNDDSLLKDLNISDFDLLLNDAESDQHVGNNRSSVVTCHVKECEQLNDYRIMLRVSFDQEDENHCIYLTENWANTDVRPGDVIQLMGNFHIPLPRDYVVGDGVCVIVNPDHLISVTTVSRAIDCERRAVLEDLLKGASCENESMLKGTLLHEVFDQALELFQNGKPVTSNALGSFIDKQLMSFYNQQKLYALGLTEAAMKESLMGMVDRLVEWCHNTLSHEGRDGIQPNRIQANSNITVTDVQDIEENVWCPRYGLKGKVDATLLVRKKDEESSSIHPLELKTGRMMNKSGSSEHRAQVILYCLMLSDRHQTAVPNGLLYYMKTGHTESVPEKRNESMSLIQKRNRLARFHGNYWDHVYLPELSRNRHMCQRCPLVKKCTLYHRVIEGGDSSCSGLKEEEYMSGHFHLNTPQLAFFKKWFSLAMEEFTYSQVDSWKEPIWRRNHMLRERENSCITSLLPREPMATDGHRVIQEFVRVDGGSIPDTNMIGHKGRVLVSKQDGTGWALTSGSIHNITASSVFLHLAKPIPVDNDGVLYCVDSAGDTNKTEMGLNNIMELCTSDSERDKRLRELIIDIDYPVFEPPSHSIPHLFTSQLNSDQQLAVEKVLCSKDYSLMLGMPGTGKTTTIASLVQVLVARGCSVLLTSYTNSAVDNVLLKLKKAGVDFLRVGSEERIHSEEILPYLIQRAAAGVDSVAQLEALYNSKKVVAATCHSTNLGHAIFSHKHFDYCVCDEATQLPLPLSLGVIRCASVFVLVGDHHQLPPLVLSPTAREGGYTETLFHILSSHHPSAVVPLTQQYRMNSDIMLLANKLIYDDKLVCGSEEVKNGCLQLANNWTTGLVPDWLEKSINPAQSVVFLNTDTCDDSDVELQSHENDLEARLTQSLVEALVKFGVNSADIMVITPYQKQVKLLNGYLPNVEVLTVDKCQGRDSECVIVSFVKKNAAGQVGVLLQNWRRINVALTRARHKLVLVGSPSTLSHIPILSSLIQLISEKHWMIDVP